MDVQATALSPFSAAAARIAILWFTLACRGAMPVVAPVQTARSCDYLPSDAPRGDTITAVITTDIHRERLTRGTNAGERFVFGGSYETLVGVACDGTLVPALAESWQQDAGGRWTFVLRPDARFWNGDDVSAANVVASWRQTAIADGDSVAARLAGSTAVVDDRTLLVSLLGAAPSVLAHSRFSVYRDAPTSTWPEGTGPWQLTQTELTELRPMNAATRRIVRVRSASATTARDFIDAGADLVLTDDPSLAAYAAVRANATSVPLAFDQVWALLLLWRDSTIAPVLDDAAVQSFRAALARDVVRGEARAATTPSLRAPAVVCPNQGGSAQRTEPTRVVYRSGDAVAGALAERIVALAAIAAAERRNEDAIAIIAPELVRAGSRLVAVPLDARAYADTIAAASTAASIVTMSSRDIAACASARVVPLVETRWRAVARERT